MTEDVRVRIPNRFHFVFGLKPQIQPFHIAEYLCLESCIQVNRPERVDLYHHYEPYGEWWERIKPKLDLHEVELESFVRDHPSYFTHEEGRFIKGWNLDYAHQSDFLRLKILLEHGGIYADMDTIFVNPLPRDLFDHEFVIGEEDPVTGPDEDEPHASLCNAFLMSAPGAEFGRSWLERMHQVFDGTWSRHSCMEAALLQAEAPHKRARRAEEESLQTSVHRGGDSSPARGCGHRQRRCLQHAPVGSSLVERFADRLHGLPCRPPHGGLHPVCRHDLQHRRQTVPGLTLTPIG